MRTNMLGPALEILSSGERALSQMEVIRDVMLSAVECAEEIARQPYMQSWDAAQIADDAGWMTLRELAQLTNYGEASISAQLRHLRKPHFGGYVVAKRRRGPVANGAWEYRIGGRTDLAWLTPPFAGARM
jgi:hypothetical protein